MGITNTWFVVNILIAVAISATMLYLGMDAVHGKVEAWYAFCVNSR